LRLEQLEASEPVDRDRPLLRAVILEVLRLLPPNGIMVKVTTGLALLLGHLLPPNSRDPSQPVCGAPRRPGLSANRRLRSAVGTGGSHRPTHISRSDWARDTASGPSSRCLSSQRSSHRYSFVMTSCWLDQALDWPGWHLRPSRAWASSSRPIMKSAQPLDCRKIGACGSRGCCDAICRNEPRRKSPFDRVWISRDKPEEEKPLFSRLSPSLISQTRETPATFRYPARHAG
jgi:hypothetical protein